MDYSKLSDRDIDALVLQRVYGNQANDKDIMRSWLRGGFKYTTNPADAYPIIKENMISLCAYKRANPGMKEVSWWEADNFCEHITRDENPLRAAMIVVLMMQESANVQDNTA